MNIDELRLRCNEINKAKTPEDLFGVLPPVSLGVLFRRMAATVHPDRFAWDPLAHKQAGDAFKRLVKLHTEAEERLALGIYGTAKAAPPAPAAFVPLDIKVGRHAFHVERLICKGDVCDIYEGTMKDVHGAGACVLKVAQHPSDNDLVENEALVLGALNAKAAGHNHARYLPELISSFTLRNPSSKSLRRVNVLPLFGEHVSIAQVISAFPNYIDFRDAAWMIKRMLEALGFVHRQGFVHGAVLPDHVLVHPLEHGAKLIGWGCAAVAGKQHVRAVCADYLNWYPPEILAKKPATPASDVYMWARTALALVGQVAPPKRFTAFLEGCLLPAPGRRPSDAWVLRDELSELLQKLVGPPTYRPFTMPVKEDAS